MGKLRTKIDKGLPRSQIQLVAESRLELVSSL